MAITKIVPSLALLLCYHLPGTTWPGPSYNVDQVATAPVLNRSKCDYYMAR